MTREDILQYNKMCAEFLWYINTTASDKDFNIYQKEGRPLIEVMSMQFHSDWTWIMEVVEAIEILIYQKREVSLVMSKYSIGFELLDEDGFPENSTIFGKYGTFGGIRKKEATVNAINEFLKKINKI